MRSTDNLYVLNDKSNYNEMKKDPVAYYKKHFDELTAKELQMEAQGFYKILRDTGNLHIVPKKIRKANKNKST